ncbi:MAG: NAD-dependent epimerase/dehydratase family protein [Bacillota bacterium]
MDLAHLDWISRKRVLVTGGAGAIGSNLTKVLLSLGCPVVIVLDDLSASPRWNLPEFHNLLFVEGDVVDEAVLKRVFTEAPEVVFHLAAFFANQNSVDYPERDLITNGLGTLRVLEYSVMSRGVERFVYASSGCSIYGDEAPLPLREEYTSTHLSTPYQITKMLGELYCNFFHHHYGLKTVKARFFNSYGPGEVPGQYRNVIPNFIYWAMQGKPLPMTGTGEETRDFTYVDDLVDGLLRAAYYDVAVGREYNLSGDAEIRILDLADMVNRLTGNTAGVRHLPRRKWDTKTRIKASIERARQELGYEPKVPFEEGLRRTVQWFRDNWDRIVQAASFGPGMSSAVREQW